MKTQEMIGMLLIFLIAFALGYIVSFPSNLDIEIELDDNFVEATENLKNASYTQCPACVCECKTERTPIYWDDIQWDWVYTTGKN